MSISKKTLEHPVLTLIVFALLGTIGIFTLKNVAVSLMPDVDSPYINVRTTYKNAGPESVEKTVTKVLDTQTSTVEKKSTTAVKNTTAAQITTAKKTAATAAKKTNASKYKYYKYTVKKGETLVSISRKVYGTQKLVKRIREANALSNQNQIYPGQKLIIPIAR